MRNLLHYLRIFYNLSRHHSKFQGIVWKNLKNYHLQAEYNSGIYELEKRVLCCFTLKDGGSARFFYEVSEGRIEYRGRVVETFDSDLTTEMFILATHFNNLLRTGKVVVDPESLYVDFVMEADLITNIMYPGEVARQTDRHFNVTSDIYWACMKLINEREEPAIIIADLIRRQEQSNSSNQ